MDLREREVSMKIYGLYGKSGTGKSHKSSEVALRYQIGAVIDDGILILDKVKIAGKSAKNEKTAMAATKRAIFQSDNHKQEVYEQLQQLDIDKLLLLGTSKKMIRMIAQRLELDDEIHWIPIEDYQSPEEIQLARERRGNGYHVIPIRPIEVENTYSGSWFRKLVIRMGRKAEEVTLVKPEYLKGKIMIHPSCFRDIIHALALPEIRIHSVKPENDTVFLQLSLRSGFTMDQLLEWQQHCSETLVKMIGFPYAIDIEWKSILTSK